MSNGMGSEIAATVQEKAFLHLEAPVRRVCGWDTPFPLVYEPYYVPDALRCFEAIRDTMEY